MSGGPHTDPVGDQVIERGWKQGSLFSAPSVVFQYNGLREPIGDPLTEAKAKSEKASRLVLVTQTCDLKSRNEARVEAMICRRETNERLISNADLNSIRWFLADPATGLVVYAIYRVTIEKRALLHLEPEPWPSGATRLERFSNWLARRYDRPALPDLLVEQFQTPLENALERFRKDSPELSKALNEAVHEFRVTLPETEIPPFDVQLLIVMRDRLSRDQADAIDAAMAVVRESITDSRIRLGPERRGTLDLISVADFRKTRPLFLEDLTYQGESISGAEPLRRQ